ncbi:MAG TPA: hypothetical protein VME46_10670 [Acidimicrobiales bacterium]|nr:hypothetical protein [Acidimicrobiales bacterium]
MFPLPLSVLMGLEEDRQHQLERLARSRHTAGPARPARRRSRRPVGRGPAWAALFGRRERVSVPAAMPVAH